MADDNQDQPDDEQARLALEEYQRQQAATAVQASQGQPNAIPNEAPQPDLTTRAVDYTQRGLPMGNVLQGEPDPNAPSTGFYINQAGENLGSTTQAAPQGAIGIQGVVSPQEVAFWQANPLGAVPHPVTGELIGLGGNVASRQAALESITPPEQIAGSRLQQPDFVNVTPVDPALIDRRNQIANEIANTQAQMRGASTQRIGRGQPSQFESLNAKLATLQHADSALANEHFRQSQQSAHAADQNRKMQEQYSIAQDATAAQIAMGRITAQPGTQEYKQAIANIALSYPHAVKDPRVEEALLKASTFHDERAAIAQKAAEAGLVEQVVGYGQKGPTIKYVAPTAGAEDALKKGYGLTPDVITNAPAMRGKIVTTDDLKANPKLLNAAGDQAKVGHFTNQYTGAEQGDTVAIATPKGKPVVMTAPEYDKYIQTFAPQKANAQPAATNQNTEQQPKGYEVGARYGDLIYNGGDPKQRASWKPVQ